MEPALANLIASSPGRALVPEPDPASAAQAPTGARLSRRQLRAQMFFLAVYGWLALTVGGSWFARRLAAARDADVGVVGSLVWQGTANAAWLLAGITVWLLMRRFGSGAIGLLALYMAGALIVPLEALIGALVDAAFVSGPILPVRTLGRLPLSIALYALIVAVGLTAARQRLAVDEQDRARALEIALEDARQALARATAEPAAPESRLIVASGARRVPVEIAEIEWFAAADRRQVAVHWSDREGLLRSTLQALEARIDPKLFARCHRSTLVNLGRVSAFAPLPDGSWRLTMESGAEVVTSRTYRRELLERLGL
ncbi:LytTR family DNA-binding domain-containing protein [uncultured Caulobacter sp.]|uniref:LytTR family DNA-binding domain-containing protein n=1 Tax=uncultured Caulobacter sp. TaxID=158749 RepID=UPI00260BE17F|nr:LytTR family DNA-binding domain-containing protein [uncultured Caulobacter sp.]